MVELTYGIELPDIEDWYLQRCDIAICYDLQNQNNVKSYINSLSRCNYPRRNAKFFYDESIYLSGTTTTLKIYNKLLEFKKHDLKHFANSNFNTLDYMNKIKGFIRFECEVKKKMLKNIYNNEKNIKLINIKYEDLKKVWCEEFMKVLQFINNDLEIVRGREEVLERLNNLYNQILDVKIIQNTYDKKIKNNTKNKQKLERFEYNYVSNIVYIKNIIEKRKYQV